MKGPILPPWDLLEGAGKRVGGVEAHVIEKRKKNKIATAYLSQFSSIQDDRF